MAATVRAWPLPARSTAALWPAEIALPTPRGRIPGAVSSVAAALVTQDG